MTEPDRLIWMWTANGSYSARSCYQATFQGSTSCHAWKLIWRNWAPPHVKFSHLLANLDRCWTADRLAHRGLQHHSACLLKTIVKRLELASEAVIEAYIDSDRLTGLVFVSERQHNLETLQIALRFTGDGDVKVFTLADIYGTELFGGARIEDSGCIAGGYEVDGQMADHYLVYVSTKEPVQERRSPWNVVYRTNLRTGETERLTPPGNFDISPSVSPSGKRVAVASFKGRNGMEKFRICRRAFM